MIPKIIHYCWFGGSPLPKEARRCIESWKTYCPDYVIKEWNENNFDFSRCAYASQAYEAKKWAFVSDYARFRILLDEGGLYFDTDVELLKPIDPIAAQGPFMGFENDEKRLVAPGLGLGAEPGMAFYQEMVSYYESIRFLNADGSCNLMTIVDRTTEMLKRYGLSDVDGIQMVAGIRLYPKAYFNPMNMNSGRIVRLPETVSIHYYAASWENDYNLFRGKVYQWATRLFGEKGAEALRKVFGRHSA